MGVNELIYVYVIYTQRCSSLTSYVSEETCVRSSPYSVGSYNIIQERQVTELELGRK